MHIWLINGQNRAFNLVGQACKVAVVIGDIAGLSDGFRRQLPAVGGLQPAQLFRVFFNQGRQTVQQLAPLGLGHIAPGGIIQNPDCGGDGAVDILRRGAGEGGPDLPRGGVVAVHNLPVGAFAPGAINEQLKMGKACHGKSFS